MDVVCSTRRTTGDDVSRLDDCRFEALLSFEIVFNLLILHFAMNVIIVVSFLIVSSIESVGLETAPISSVAIFLPV